MTENDPNNFQLITLKQLDELKRKIKKNKKITIDLSGTKYELLRTVANLFDWNIQEKSNESKPFNIRWYDYYIQEDDVRRLLPYQKINHFPGSQWQFLNFSLGKKNNLGKYLHKLQRIFPNEYSFFPKTWILPYQLEEFRNYFNNKNLQKNQKFFIAKPEAGCQGRGIFIFNKAETIEQFEKTIVQQYITNPLLIDGLKFDCRIYVLVKSIDPLKIFMYRDGLARFATTEFKAPKTIAAVQPMMLHAYKTSRPNGEQMEVCFEILGFDILIDNDLKPWLIEVNHTPSFQTDSELDFIIKKNLILDTLLLMRIKNQDKKMQQSNFRYNEIKGNLPFSQVSKQLTNQNYKSPENTEKFENKNLNGYMRVYPTFPHENNPQDINGYIEMAKKIWDAWAGPKNKVLLQETLTTNSKKIEKVDYKLQNQQKKPPIYKHQRSYKLLEVKKSEFTQQNPQQQDNQQQSQNNHVRPPSAFSALNKLKRTTLPGTNYNGQQFEALNLNTNLVQLQKKQYEIDNQLYHIQNEPNICGSIAQKTVPNQNESENFNSIQEFLKNTNTIYNNYINNITQYKFVQKNQKQNKIKSPRVPLVKGLGSTLVIQNNHNKPNFKIQGNSYGKLNDQQSKDSLVIYNNFTNIKKQQQDQFSLNKFNYNFISINSKQNIYKDE